MQVRTRNLGCLRPAAGAAARAARRGTARRARVSAHPAAAPRAPHAPPAASRALCWGGRGVAGGRRGRATGAHCRRARAPALQPLADLDRPSSPSHAPHGRPGPAAARAGRWRLARVPGGGPAPPPQQRGPLRAPPTPPGSVDLVLSSGFLAFAHHAGFLQAVEDAGLSVGGVMGTSAGALTGALYAAGHSPAAVARELSAVPPIRYLRPAWPWRGVASLAGVVDRLRDLLPPTFEDLPTEFCVGVVAADGRHVLLDSGPLPEAVAASAAIPGLFAPLAIAGAPHPGPFRDGGVVDRTGLRAWRARRASQAASAARRGVSPSPRLPPLSTSSTGRPPSPATMTWRGRGSGACWSCGRRARAPRCGRWASSTPSARPPARARGARWRRRRRPRGRASRRGEEGVFFGGGGGGEFESRGSSDARARTNPTPTPLGRERRSRERERRENHGASAPVSRRRASGAPLCRPRANTH